MGKSGAPAPHGGFAAGLHSIVVSNGDDLFLLVIVLTTQNIPKSNSRTLPNKKCEFSPSGEALSLCMGASRVRECCRIITANVAKDANDITGVSKLDKMMSRQYDICLVCQTLQTRVANARSPTATSPLPACLRDSLSRRSLMSTQQAVRDEKTTVRSHSNRIRVPLQRHSYHSEASSSLQAAPARVTRWDMSLKLVMAASASVCCYVLLLFSLKGTSLTLKKSPSSKIKQQNSEPPAMLMGSSCSIQFHLLAAINSKLQTDYVATDRHSEMHHHQGAKSRFL